MYTELFLSFFNFQVIGYFNRPILLIGYDSLFFDEVQKNLGDKQLLVKKFPLFNTENTGSYYLYQVISLYPDGAIVLLNMTYTQLKSYSSVSLNISSYNTKYISISLNTNYQIVEKEKLNNIYFYDFIEYGSEDLNILREKLVALGDINASITSLMLISYQIVIINNKNRLKK